MKDMYKTPISKNLHENMSSVLVKLLNCIEYLHKLDHRYTYVRVSILKINFSSIPIRTI